MILSLIWPDLFKNLGLSDCIMFQIDSKNTLNSFLTKCDLGVFWHIGSHMNEIPKKYYIVALPVILVAWLYYFFFGLS